MLVSGAVISRSLTSFAGLAANSNGKAYTKEQVDEKKNGMVK
jgi:hypothetical protein